MPKNSPTKWSLVPARRSNEATATKRARRTIVVLLVAALAGPLSFLLTVARGAPELDLSPIVPEGRSIADAAAYQFLTGQPVTVPSANTLDVDDLRFIRGSGGKPTMPYPTSSITWDRFEKLTFTGPTELVANFEIHKFLVIPAIPEASGAYLEQDPADAGEEQPTTDPNALRVPQMLEVPILLSSEGPRLAAAPAFSPWAPASESQYGVADYSDFNTGQTVDVPPQVTAQVSRWAKAYAEDDRETLLTVTGDTNKDHVYMGLGGFTIPAEGSQVQILTATNGGPETLILRVRVRMQENTTAGAANEEQLPHTSVQDFDLFVKNPNSALPPIESWGVAGSAAGHSPHGNAFGG